MVLRYPFNVPAKGELPTLSRSSQTRSRGQKINAFTLILKYKNVFFLPMKTWFLTIFQKITMNFGIWEFKLLVLRDQKELGGVQ